MNYKRLVAQTMFLNLEAGGLFTKLDPSKIISHVLPSLIDTAGYKSLAGLIRVIELEDNSIPF